MANCLVADRRKTVLFSIVIVLCILCCGIVLWRYVCGLMNEGTVVVDELGREIMGMTNWTVEICFELVPEFFVAARIESRSNAMTGI